MKKQFFIPIGILLILMFSIIIYAENESTTNEGDSNSLDEQANQETSSSTPITESNQENGETEFNADPGITPDSPLYFIDDLAERVSVGNNPEKALQYKEEKIAEAQVMVDKEMPEEAQKVLDKALEYNDIVEIEVSPDIQGKVKESGERVQSAINNMKEKTEGEQWKEVNEGFDENIEKEKRVGTAAELSSKIKELCETLAKLDPLQYADSCKSKDNSPKWMKEQDKELTAEQEQQSRIFFDELSACFENPKQCDCKSMGVQKFEDFCVEQSALAVKCMDGDKTACENMNNGAPEDLLPDYLIPVMKKVEAKYSNAQFDNFAPEECVKANAKTPEECNRIMFKLNAPQECLDAKLTGESREDEAKCRNIMFQENTPKECADAGITPQDKDGARKCTKIMFQSRAPQQCLDIGLTGESREDEKKCRELMQNQGEDYKQGTNTYAPQFNRDCNSIKDVNEKMKCFEEFYNNAQVQIKDDFRQREMIDQNTGEKITAEEEAQRKVCRDKGMGTILENENGKRIVICVDKNQPGAQGGQQCQGQDQIEKLKQDCKSRGQDAQVENRGGCPWVICIGQGNQNSMNQQPGQYVAGDKSGIKCPDNICDDYEKMNSYACPEDCGGTRQPGNYPQQQPGDYQQPENRIDEQQQPNQNQENFCSGQAPSCAPNGAPYCQNGNWVCPQAPQQEQQTQQEQQPQTSPSPTETAPATESSPAPEPSAPITGGTITGRIIVSNYGDENSRDGDRFLDYWFNR
ncbi:MAG: hypothetical protein COY66_00030 [Candidatus Kerfeldbacteria bacterium CG_4_10_14_0_8_um_filter_42_10]|uniref:DUF5667 domain-containing protein n=1 Tax=Candidatus Kerfeldbacteria bacterium CG_4_10_14_0_8_um_filter_42_10 TaxID=2014248 RepID=A0A2M7RLD2_9BACT|nr:MAG: hypothetical protein COY66_00030 [Candidatus Kerfeldbacteria bacterium CG_4_10_14_0_8_um_filter_42_10]